MTLKGIQEAVFGILENDGDLRRLNIRIVRVDDGSTKSKIEQAMGKLGICIAVRMAKFTPTSQAGKNAVGEAGIVVAVGETPAFNRSRDIPGGVCGQDLAEFVAWRLNMERITPRGDTLVLSGTMETVPADEGASTITTIPFKLEHQLTNNLKELT